MGGCSRMDDIELTIRAAGRPSEWNGLALLPFPERATYVRVFNVGASRARFFLSFFHPCTLTQACMLIYILYVVCRVSVY
jgi:hypothetical protein